MNEEKDIEHLLLAHFLDQLDEPQETEVSALISSNEEVREQYAEVQRQAVLSSFSAPNHNFDPTSAKAKIWSNTVQKETKQFWKPNTMLTVAASVAIMLIGTWFMMRGESASFQTNDTKLISQKLPDGSIVDMNKNSTVIYKNVVFKNQREISLEGEAYFEVAHDPAHPFIVRTQDATITVVGTKFNIKTSPSTKTEVLVTEGKVLVQYDDSKEKITLSKGNSVYEVDGSIRVSSAYDENRMVWKSGVLNFEYAKLSEVISTLENQFNVGIDVEDIVILDCLISVRFRNQDIDTILAVISKTYNLQVTKKSKRFLISGKGC